MTSVPSSIETYYESEYCEETRLRRSLKGNIELKRMQKLILSHLLPSAADAPVPFQVADIGGGCGVHTELMGAHQNVRPQLADVISKHVDTARSKSLDAVLADARDLPWASGRFHAALMAGPLYHLKDPAHRTQALAEMIRVCEPGSPVIITGLNRYGPLIGSTIAMTLRTPEHQRAVRSVMKSGKCEAPGWIGQAYYHTHDEFMREASAAGLTDIKIVGVGGPGTWLGVLASCYLGPESEPDGAVDVAMWSAEEADSVPELTVLSSMYAILARTPA